MLKRLLRPWLSPLRDFRDFRRRGRAPVTVSAAVAGGTVDAVHIYSDGIVAAHGWAPNLDQFRDALRLSIDGDLLAPAHAFRVPRPDRESASASSFLGAAVEWVLAPCERSRSAALIAGGATIASLDLQVIADPPYGRLRDERTILHRDHIYGHGTPSPIVSDEVRFLARGLPPPILDFGCGAGALVAALRRDGLDAVGLELDAPRIHDHLLPDARPHVTVYNGALPTRFRDRQFGSVVCSEVIEHVDAPEAVIAELVRLAPVLLITVPDMSAIPRASAHLVVPWHLLEGTHVNFFTQHSLEAALRPFAKTIEVSRIGRVRCDRTTYYTSLAARVTV